MIPFGGLVFRLNCLKPPALFLIQNVSSQRVSMCWSLDKTHVFISPSHLPLLQATWLYGIQMTGLLLVCILQFFNSMILGSLLISFNLSVLIARKLQVGHICVLFFFFFF